MINTMNLAGEKAIYIDNFSNSLKFCGKWFSTNLKKILNPEEFFQLCIRILIQ